VRLMSMADIASDNSSPYHQLDELYLQVLREAFPSISQDQRVRLKMVLGTIVLLFDPLGPGHLAALLCLNEETLLQTLLSLHSMVIVSDSGGGSIRLIHPSSHDFLVDANRCNDTNFAVNARIQHALLAEYCLRTLQMLSPDMCRIRDASLYNQEVPYLRNRIASRIPAHMRYACQHWASHLNEGGIHDKTLDLLLEFCSNHLLNWLEVMSLLGELDGAVLALQTTYKVVEVR
jgi:hypothetical protein